MKLRSTLPVLAAAATMSLTAATAFAQDTGQRVSGMLSGPLNNIPATCNSCHGSHDVAAQKLSRRIANPAAGLTPLQDATRTINARLQLGQKCFINKVGASNIANMQHFAGPTNQSGELGAFEATLNDGQTIQALMVAQPIPGTTNQAQLFLVFPKGEFSDCTL